MNRSSAGRVFAVVKSTDHRPEESVEPMVWWPTWYLQSAMGDSSPRLRKTPCIDAGDVAGDVVGSAGCLTARLSGETGFSSVPVRDWTVVDTLERAESIGTRE